MNFLDISAGYEQPLESRGDLPERVHVFDEKSIEAVNAALAARRPLLVLGEPGVGKSQLARAAAAKLRRVYVQHVVDANTESRDLLWHFDAVQRLADAQARDPDGKGLDIRRYIDPGPLWWALNWSRAIQPADDLEARQPPPQHKEASAENGCVLLIDEIDKAEMDVPNGLLEALGEGQFTPQGYKKPVVADGKHPLVIITSNGERSLPPAFRRRCLILRMSLFEAGCQRETVLIERGRAHFAELDEDVLAKAARILLRDRDQADEMQQRPLPGQAEYLDLLRVAHTRAKGDKARQLKLLDDVAEFVVRKHES